MVWTTCFWWSLAEIGGKKTLATEEDVLNLVWQYSVGIDGKRALATEVKLV